MGEKFWKPDDRWFLLQWAGLHGAVGVAFWLGATFLLHERQLAWAGFYMVIPSAFAVAALNEWNAKKRIHAWVVGAAFCGLLVIGGTAVILVPSGSVSILLGGALIVGVLTAIGVALCTRAFLATALAAFSCALLFLLLMLVVMFGAWSGLLVVCTSVLAGSLAFDGIAGRRRAQQRVPA